MAYNPGYLTRNATGGWTLTAVGSNQSITLTPSGSGNTILSSGNLLLNGVTNGTGVLQFPAATNPAGGIAFGVDVSAYRSAAGSLALSAPLGGEITLRFVGSSSEQGRLETSGTSMYLSASNGGSLILRSGSATTALTLDSSQGVTTAKKIVSYNGVATTGWGVPSIVATGRFVAQSAAGNITNGSYTVGAADGTFEISGNINVISAVAVSTSLNVTYTDETNTSRTMILPLSGLAGSFVAAGLATTTGPFESAVMHIRCKASTAITFAVAAGTFTTVSYNAECTIKQTA